MTARRLSDALTGLAARSFPRSRGDDALVVRDGAREAVEASGPRALPREVIALAGAGLRIRFGVATRDLRAAPWRAALSALTLPLAATLLCLWTFGFVPRYDRWPLGEGWMLLLGGSLVAVIGAALESRRLTALGAGATLVAAAAPYLGMGTDEALADTPSFFHASGVDLGAASLMPTLLLLGAAWCLPRGWGGDVRRALDRLALGLLPTAVALVHLLPRPRPEPSIGFLYEGPGRDPTVSFGPPYPFPQLVESSAFLTAFGIALLVAVVVSWRTAKTRPEAALATALVLVAVAHPLAWVWHGYRVWPLICVPLALALLLTWKAARVQRSVPSPAA